MKVEDRLDGTSNFSSWKSRVLLILKENDLLKFMNENVPEPKDEAEKAQWRKNDARERRILVDSVKDHLVPHISEKMTARKMFRASKKLFQDSNINHALALRNQLLNLKISRSESVSSHFMRISELKNQLNIIGDSVNDKELVMNTLNGLPPSWKAFFQSLVGQPKLPKFDCI